VSLRIFHLLFITVSALLAVFCAGWAATAYRADQGVLYAAVSVLSVVAAVGLVGYGAVFQRKTRGLS
jgi:hypothetical protein